MDKSDRVAVDFENCISTNITSILSGPIPMRKKAAGCQRLYAVIST